MSILHCIVKKTLQNPSTFYGSYSEVKGEESKEGRKRWKKPPFAVFHPFRFFSTHKRLEWQMDLMKSVV